MTSKLHINLLGNLLQTLWMTLCYHKKSEYKKAPQNKIHLAEIWLLTVADSEHTNFISGMIGTFKINL